MKKLIISAAALVSATPALAQEEPPREFEVAGTAAIVSDYRFRGVSQTDKQMAVQAGVSVTHQSGLYAGVWASNLAGWGTFGGANMELDVYGGYALQLGGAKVDVGLTWYMYPGGADVTDFAEPYVKVSGTLGPVNALVGVAYAPEQRALGRWYFTGADAASGIYNAPGDKQDNLYVWTDLNAAVPGTPFTLKGHVGHSSGNSGLGPNGTSLTPTGSYWDWSLGADAALGPLVVGVSYVDTSISTAGSAYLQPNFSSTKNGSSIAGSTVVFSLSAAF